MFDVLKMIKENLLQINETIEFKILRYKIH